MYWSTVSGSGDRQGVYQGFVSACIDLVIGCRQAVWFPVSTVMKRSIMSGSKHRLSLFHGIRGPSPNHDISRADFPSADLSEDLLASGVILSVPQLFCLQSR